MRLPSHLDGGKKMDINKKEEEMKLWCGHCQKYVVVKQSTCSIRFPSMFGPCRYFCIHCGRLAGNQGLKVTGTWNPKFAIFESEDDKNDNSK